ncbi:MAG: di-heme oxidoredictase family protein [Terriglobales bacterium]
MFDLARDQCKKSKGKICGQVLRVPIVEATGKTGVGKFGWKDQHASLLSFAGDAYLNEMGITNKLFPTEVTLLCNTVREPNDVPGADGLEHIDLFARFVRATEAPARDAQRAGMRTAPLWGVRLRTRLMHDGTSLTFPDAILRHRGEALHVTQKFEKLKPKDQEALIDFLKSL